MALAGCVAVLLPLAATAYAVVAVAERGERAAVDRQVRASLDTLRQPAAGVLTGVGPGTGPSDRPAGPPAPPPGALDPGGGAYLRVTDARGATRLVEGRRDLGPVPAPPVDGDLRTVTAAGGQWRTGAVSLGAAGTLQIAVPLAPLHRRLRDLYAVAVASLVSAFAASALLAWALAQVALAPLRRLRAAAVRVGRHPEADLRVPDDPRPEETAALARELNTMLGRLQQARDALDAALAGTRRFAADAGHELRTPLASLAIGLSTLRAGDPGSRRAALATAEDDVARMSALVEQLQDLARGEAPLPRSPEPVDLGELADAAADAVRGRHPGLSVEVVAPPSGPTLTGDPDGLRTVLDNLLENVARHAGPRAAATVFLRQVDGRTTLTVDDDGPGVPVAERHAVLERFARGAAATSVGTGLGLAIVVAETRRHGGTVALRTSPAGGLRVELSFPSQHR
jgi:signal transduction histidine kinase